MRKSLQYPIGEFKAPERLTNDDIAQWILDIEETPERLKMALAGLSPQLMDTPYRHGGWTVKQVVHHLADSHMNSYIRFKLALTEDKPAIKAYDENSWALLPDSTELPVDVSVQLLESLHIRWSHLLRSMSKADYDKRFYHPGMGSFISLATTLALYSWHGRHHIEHIKLVNVH
ncbi:metal-dependent hydrolase [Bacillus sp. SA1-12]|uniref:YfiT family bacillithiol transferase n=1 Tax=Bacillus sp. SA1-12 TaxID=1455638 RepID=UPI000626B136|nr:bacillithiol transferase BstA [Bacillus sp. SA1-12]KKI92223.1 metal-dependent hydrolase [Bacillus sp. SA1-12]